MKVGDLVKELSLAEPEKEVYTDFEVIGLILEEGGCYNHFFFVSWNNGRLYWTTLEEIEVISENR